MRHDPIQLSRWTERLQDCALSGIAVRANCRRESIGSSTFCACRKKSHKKKTSAQSCERSKFTSRSAPGRLVSEHGIRSHRSKIRPRSKLCRGLKKRVHFYKQHSRTMLSNMSRPLRIAFPCAICHVTSSGNARAAFAR